MVRNLSSGWEYTSLAEIDGIIRSSQISGKLQGITERQHQKPSRWLGFSIIRFNVANPHFAVEQRRTSLLPLPYAGEGTNRFIS